MNLNIYHPIVLMSLTLYKHADYILYDFVPFSMIIIMYLLGKNELFARNNDKICHCINLL